jgi:hypothetical protein
MFKVLLRSPCLEASNEKVVGERASGKVDKRNQKANMPTGLPAIP